MQTPPIDAQPPWTLIFLFVVMLVWVGIQAIGWWNRRK
jgi:hypothetical protein